MEPEDVYLEFYLREISHASEELSDFLIWVAHNDNISPEDFRMISEAAHKYALTKNEVGVQDGSDQSW